MLRIIVCHPMGIWYFESPDQDDAYAASEAVLEAIEPFDLNEIGALKSRACRIWLD